jgi:hypothetical protein
MLVRIAACVNAVKQTVAIASAAAAGALSPRKVDGMNTIVAEMIDSTKCTRLSVSAFSVGAAWCTAWNRVHVARSTRRGRVGCPVPSRAPRWVAMVPVTGPRREGSDVPPRATPNPASQAGRPSEVSGAAVRDVQLGAVLQSGS